MSVTPLQRDKCLDTSWRQWLSSRLPEHGGRSRGGQHEVPVRGHSPRGSAGPGWRSEQSWNRYSERYISLPAVVIM